MNQPTIHEFIIEIVITPAESTYTKIEIKAPRPYAQDILDDLALSMASAILPGNPEIIYRQAGAQYTIQKELSNANQ